MSRYRIDDSDRPFATKFLANPVGYHSPGLAARPQYAVHIDAARHVLDMVVRHDLKPGDHLREQAVADGPGIHAARRGGA